MYILGSNCALEQSSLILYVTDTHIQKYIYDLSDWISICTQWCSRPYM